MRTLLFALALFVVSLEPTCIVHAQQSGGSSGSGTDANGSPIDVPDIIIKGSASIKLMATSFSKQMPSATRPLRGTQLDSLNPLEKQSPSLLSLSPTQSDMWTYQPRNTVIGMQLGIFQTPQFNISYGTALGDYAVYARGNYQSSHGYSANTDFSDFGALLSVRHHEHDGDGLFAGSESSADINLQNSSYKLFARTDSVPQRGVQSIGLNLHSTNETSSIPFDAYAGIGSTTIRDEEFLQRSSSELALRAGLECRTPWTNLEPGAYAHVDLRPTSGTTMSAIDAGLLCVMRDSSQKLELRAGIQSVSDSHGVNWNEITFHAAYDFTLSNQLQASLLVRRELNTCFLSDRIRINPYLSTSTDLIPDRTSYDIDASIHSTPQITLEWAAGIRAVSFAQLACTVLDSSRQLTLMSLPATLWSVHAEALWHFNEQSSVTASLSFNSPSLASGHATPYIAPIVSNLRYHGQWSDRWSGDAWVSYTGARNIRIDADSTLPGYFLLNASLQYRIVDGLSLRAYVENITNSSIFVYEGYRARGAFASLGLEWKF